MTRAQPGRVDAVRIAACLLLIAAPARALTLVNSTEDLNDGVLSGSGEAITNNLSNRITFRWDDRNGDGTLGDNVSSNLYMAGKTLRRYATAQWDINAATGIVLNLDIAGVPGVITNSGAITTSLSQYNYYSGSLTITNASHISLTAIDLNGEGGGGATLVHTGNLTVAGSFLDNHRTGGRSLVLDGRNGGALTIGNGLVRVLADGTGYDTIIRNYTGVTVSGTGYYDSGVLGAYGDYSINVAGGANYSTHDVIITNIGPGGVTVAGGISTRAAKNPVNRAIMIQTIGAVNVGNLHTYGSFSESDKYGGDIRVTAAGNITISGTINADNAYQASNDGILSLNATGATAQVFVNNLDCSKFRISGSYWTFNSGCGRSTVTGVISNFDTTNSPSNELRAPAGQVVYYDPKVAGNEYLARKRYVLAGGGLLRPPASGTVVVFK